MTPILENAELSTDLDAQLHNILNLGLLSPPPAGLVLSTDSRLSDARVPLDGSVTDSSVAVGAAIAQSKLDLDGNIPAAWLGTGATQAAQGNLAEYLANKGQPNGYASLDSGGKVPSAQMPATAGAGTVTSVGLTMPAQFAVSGTPVTGAGTLAIAWNTVADQSWFGNNSGGVAAPQFYTTPLPASLIPSLDASVVTSGTLSAARLPVAVGIGIGHLPGAVPDPGPSGGGALATDYLARDMTYKPAPTIGPTYQPTLATPTINPAPNLTGAVVVTVTADPATQVILYSLTASTGPFVEFPSVGYVSVPTGPTTVYVYVAAAGFNNSAIASWTNNNP